jgi:cytochrome c oxidase assembly factor CtaG
MWLGAVLPPSGGPGAWLTQWRLDPLTVALFLGAASLYAVGVIRARRLGPWRAGRVIAFASGLAVLVAALCSPVDAYADVSFLTHMVQHLFLTLLAPPLLALGAPITLALRAGGPRTRRAVVRVLRSRPAAFLALPLVGFVLFVAVPVLAHATPLFDVALRSGGWHAFEHALWLSAALVYWWPIVGADPMPRPVSYPVRLLSLFLVMPIMSFLALALYTAGAPLYPTYAGLPAPWGPQALASQHGAAVLMWLVGNLALVIALLLVAAAWKRDEDRRQARLEEREDREAAGDQGRMGDQSSTSSTRTASTS